MHNSQCGACQAVLVISEYNLNYCPPPHCLLAASCSQSGQARWYSHHVVSQAGVSRCVPPGEAWGSFLLVDGTGVCTETQPACLKGPAVPVNTAELWGPHTC